MRILDIFLLVVLSLLFFNCERKENKGFLINGEVQGESDGYIYLKYNDVIDSSLVTNQRFSFEGVISHPVEATLSPTTPTSKEMMFIGSFMLENSEIRISIKLSKAKFDRKEVHSLDIVNVSGSKSEELKRNFDLKFEETFNSVENDSLKEVLLYDHLSDFVKANPKSVLSGNYLVSISNYYGYLSSDQIENLFRIIDTNYQNKKDIADIKSIIKRRRILDIGKIPPKILLPDQYGELIDSQKLEGDFILLEFWASWCAPCRQVNPALLKVYNSYKNNGFEILGISQDQDIGKWKDAIKKDGINWIQVIDTLNSTRETFSLTTIPYNVLLNKERKIIAVNINPVKLNELLNEKLKIKSITGN